MIVEKIITLSDNTEFKFKYDNTPIAINGDNAYITENAKNNLYCAYQIDDLNKVIPAHESPSKITSSSFNGYPENGFLFDNSSLTWDINYDHYETKAFFANTVFVWYDNNVPYIVTEIDTSRLLYKPTVTHPTEYYKLPLSTSLSENSCVILSADKTQQLNTINICPFTIINNSNKLYTFFTFQDVSDTINNTKSNSIESSYSNGFVHNRSTCINSEYTGEIYLALPENAKFVVGATSGKTQAFPVNDDIDLYIKAGGNPSYKSARAFNRLKTEHIVKYCLAGRGLAFLYNDTVIYPIINGGIVTGYTENINDSGDYKDYKGIHDHETPVTPIDDGDKIDDMTIDTSEEGGSGIAGAVTYYTMTTSQLASFMSALETETIEHPDIASGFVTASYVPNVLDSVTRATDMPITVKGVQLTAHGNKVIIQHAILLASFFVPARHGNALDTLTKYFLYTPYTDVIPLNYKCFGRTLTIYLLPSLQDCTASIVVQCDGMIIAKQTVSLGSSLTISLENSAEKSTAIVNACSKYLASAGGVISGAVTGNLPAVAGGAIGVVASTVNVLNAIGNTYIHSYGTTTGTTLTLNPKNIYIIEYVVQADKPDNFAATVGNLCNKELTLSENMGYTVCDNPKVYGTMTLAERTEIENYLRSGVIL